MLLFTGMIELVQAPLIGRGVNAETIRLLTERVLYPHQKIIYVGKGRLIIKDKIQHGILCITNCALTFYQPLDGNAYDYNLKDILDVSYKKRFFSSDVEISLSNSVKILIKNIPKGQEETMRGLLGQTVEQWKQFEENQETKGFFRYGLHQDKWGTKEEAQRWLKQHLASRGFKKIEGKWMTKQEHFDYRQRQKGLYK